MKKRRERGAIQVRQLHRFGAIRIRCPKFKLGRANQSFGEQALEVGEFLFELGETFLAGGVLFFFERLFFHLELHDLAFEDVDRSLLAMEAVPQPHENWKTMLLRGRPAMRGAYPGALPGPASCRWRRRRVTT